MNLLLVVLAVLLQRCPNSDSLLCLGSYKVIKSVGDVQHKALHSCALAVQLLEHRVDSAAWYYLHLGVDLLLGAQVYNLLCSTHAANQAA
jgi:hypothetical protein